MVTFFFKAGGKSKIFEFFEKKKIRKKKTYLRSQSSDPLYWSGIFGFAQSYYIDPGQFFQIPDSDSEPPLISESRGFGT